MGKSQGARRRGRRTALTFPEVVSPQMDAILCQLKQVLAIKGSAGVRCYVDRAQLQNLLNVSLEAG